MSPVQTQIIIILVFIRGDGLEIKHLNAVSAAATTLQRHGKCVATLNNVEQAQARLRLARLTSRSRWCGNNRRTSDCCRARGSCTIGALRGLQRLTRQFPHGGAEGIEVALSEEEEGKRYRRIDRCGRHALRRIAWRPGAAQVTLRHSIYNCRRRPQRQRSGSAAAHSTRSFKTGCAGDALRLRCHRCDCCDCFRSGCVHIGDDTGSISAA